MEQFWKPKDEYFWNLAKLSVEYSNKFYTTVLYSDKRTYDIFTSKGIVFDEWVDMSKEFHKITIHNYSMAKIESMIRQTTPYVVLDLDILLFEKIHSPHSVTFGFKEVDTTSIDTLHAKGSHLDYINEYYKKYYDRFRNNVVDTPVDFDWCVFPNNSIVIVNNPHIVSEVYQYILNLLGDDIYKIPPTYTAQFYEQFLFYNYLKYYNTDIGFIYDKTPNPKFDKKENDFKHLYSNKFLHLESYDKDSDMRSVIDYLKKQWDEKNQNTKRSSIGMI